MKFNKALIFILSLTFCGPILAQTLKPLANEKGKFGYVDEQGNFAIAPQYDEAQPFVDGKAIVRKGHSYGLIDSSNKPIIPLKYDLMSQTATGAYMVAAEGKIKDGRLIEEKYGFISPDGQILLKPEYVEMSDFRHHGLATIRHKSGKIGFIDQNYAFVIPAQFDFTGSFNANGVNWLNVGGKLNENGQVRGGRFYLVNSAGEMFVPGEHASIGYFAPNNFRYSQESLNRMSPTFQRLAVDNPAHYYQQRIYMNTTPGFEIPVDIKGFWASTYPDGTRNGVYDSEGRTLIQPNVYYWAAIPDNGVAVVAFKPEQLNYLNVATGELVLTSNIQRAFGFQEGYAVCTVSNKDYIVDMAGGCKSKGYETIFPIKDDMHIVYDNGVYGVIGRDGHEIIPCGYSDIWPVSYGHVVVNTGGKFSYANANGFVSTPDFNQANSFYQGYAWAKTGEGWDLYDTSFNKINTTPMQSGKLSPEVGYFWGKENGSVHYQLFSLENGRKVLDDKFYDVECFNTHRPDVAMVSKVNCSGKWGFIDLKGNEIIPCELDKEIAPLAYDHYVERGCKPWSAIDSHLMNVRNNPSRNKFQLNNIIDNSFWDF